MYSSALIGILLGFLPFPTPLSRVCLVHNLVRIAYVAVLQVE